MTFQRKNEHKFWSYEYKKLTKDVKNQVQNVHLGIPAIFVVLSYEIQRYTKSGYAISGTKNANVQINSCAVW